jgi:hypothetical protein
MQRNDEGKWEPISRFWEKLKDPEYVSTLGITAEDLPELTGHVIRLFKSGDFMRWMAGFIQDRDNIPDLVKLMVECKSDKYGLAVLFGYRSILKLPSGSSPLIKFVRREYRKILDTFNELLDMNKKIRDLLDRLEKHQQNAKFREDLSDFASTLRDAAIALEGSNLIHCIKRLSGKNSKFISDLKALMAFAERSEHFVVWTWVCTGTTAMHYDNLKRYFDRRYLKTKQELMNAIKNVADLNYDILMSYHSSLYRLYLSPYYALVDDHQDVFSLEYEMFHPHFVDIMQLHREEDQDKLPPTKCQPLPGHFFRAREEDPVETPVVADDEVLLGRELAQLDID